MMHSYLYAHQALPLSQQLFLQLPLLLPSLLLLSMSRLLSLQGCQLLPLLLQAALLLLFDQRAGPRAGPRQRRAGGGALAQGLPLVLDEAILLNHHRLSRRNEERTVSHRLSCFQTRNNGKKLDRAASFQL